MMLSILITATKEHRKSLDVLLGILLPQIKGYDDQLEIFIEGHHDKGKGAKMNDLLKDAIGKYVWFLDETDVISHTAIADLFSCFPLEPDVITISGMSTFNGRNPFDWKQGPNEERKPNHNSPMRRDLANIIEFRKRKCDALKIWAKEMNKIQPWVSQVEIEKPIIHNRHELTGHTQTRN